MLLQAALRGGLLIFDKIYGFSYVKLKYLDNVIQVWGGVGLHLIHPQISGRADGRIRWEWVRLSPRFYHQHRLWSSTYY